MNKSLNDLNIGDIGKVINLGEKGPSRRRLMDMGITPGVEIEIVKVAPLGDPIEVNIRGYELTLRKEEAKQIKVSQSID